ncbi:MAG: hypothetical protein JWN72_844 [Thermoleophilia bacterium]|nr:hypothetical protein [Thermoleophilia bacterium]
MQLSSIAPVRASHAFAPAAAVTSPIAWLLVEERGSFRSDGRYDLTTINLEPAENGRAQLSDGRMTYPRDRGTTEFWYESSPWALRDGVDPEAAAQAAYDGVNLLTAQVERAVGDLGAFAVPMNDRLPRNPDSFEIWLRREDGNRSRFVIPSEQMPASLLDAKAAMLALAGVMRKNYDRLDPQDQNAAVSS